MAAAPLPWFGLLERNPAWRAQIRFNPEDATVTRSNRNTPVRGVTTAESEKADKAASHRRLRRVAKQTIESTPETPVPLERKLTNPWSMAKDGKFRFDPRMHPRLMRK